MAKVLIIATSLTLLAVIGATYWSFMPVPRRTGISLGLLGDVLARLLRLPFYVRDYLKFGAASRSS